MNLSKLHATFFRWLQYPMQSAILDDLKPLLSYEQQAMLASYAVPRALDWLLISWATLDLQCKPEVLC